MLELASVSRDAELRRELLTFVFCGGGFSGIEGAAAIEDLVHEALHYYPSIAPDEPRFILAPARRPSARPDRRAARRVRARGLRKRSVDVRLGVGVTEVTARSATLSTGEVLPTRTVMWAAGIEVNPLLHDVDLPKDAHGALRGGPQPAGGRSRQRLRAGRLRRGAHRRPRRLLRADRPERRARGTGGRREHPGAAARRAGRHAPSTTRRSAASPAWVTARRWPRSRGIKLAGVPAWFAWRGVYLGKMPRFSRKLQVALDWAGDLFSPAEITYLPMGTYVRVRSDDERRNGRSVGRQPPSRQANVAQHQAFALAS